MVSWPCRIEGAARVDVIGIRCYSSDDLANWDNEGDGSKGFPTCFVFGDAAIARF